MSYLGKEEATPANPAATEHKFYFKADGMMYMLNSAGMETMMIDSRSLTNTESILNLSILGGGL